MAVATALSIGSILAPIAGGVIGSLSSSSDRDKAAQVMQEAYEMLQNTPMPPDLSKRLVIEKLQSAGVWKPEMEEAIDAGISQVSQIQEDPLFRQKQLATLAALEDISKTGMTATGRAEFNKLRMQAARDAAARRESVLQQLQARGLGGGGAALVAQLSAGQAADVSAAEAADRLAAQQEQAKMDAIAKLGSMSGQVRGQEFDINRARAEAADAMRKFDIGAQREQQARNVAARTEAAKYDIMNQQRISDYNIQRANEETLRQAAAQRQYWQDVLSRTQGIAGAKLGQGQQYQQQAQNKAQSWSGIGSAVGQGLSGLSDYYSPYKQAQIDKEKAQASYYKSLSGSPQQLEFKDKTPQDVNFDNWVEENRKQQGLGGINWEE